MEHVALVEDHGVPDPGADRLLPGGVERLDDAFGNPNGSGCLGLREGRGLVVVRPVPQSPERFQVAPGLFHDGLAAVTEAKDQVLMRPVGPGHGELQIGQQAPGDVEGRVVRPADGSALVCLAAPRGQSGGQQQEVPPVHRQPSTK
jgi:hypothetical protein